MIIIMIIITMIYCMVSSLCGDRDETINHIISEYSKLTQKEYKARHDWEMSKKFKFDHANKWYMHNPAPVLENDTYGTLIYQRIT